VIAQIEFFAIRHGLKLDHLLWDMESARLMQLLYCEPISRGATMRYAAAIEDQHTNKKLEQLERNLEQWQSELR
jgi:hypothetical protein